MTITVLWMISRIFQIVFFLWWTSTTTVWIFKTAIKYIISFNRVEVSHRAAEVDTLNDQLTEERKRSRELQWAMEKERCQTGRNEESKREELEVRCVFYGVSLLFFEFKRVMREGSFKQMLYVVKTEVFSLGTHEKWPQSCIIHIFTFRF